MARLMLYLNDQFLHDIPLTRETVTIGRKPDNDVRLDHHAVSGYHAQVITLLNDSLVEDLESTNGTRVNETPVRKRALREGDEIGIHHYRLVYTRLSDAAQPVEPGPMERTVIIRTDSIGLPNDPADAKLEHAVQQLDRALSGADPATPPARALSRPVVSSARTGKPAPQKKDKGGARHAARLQLLSGPNAGRSLELAKPLTTLGRPGVQVAAISRRPQGYVIIHVDGGASGESPTVNGQHIGRESRGLADGDVIHIAGVRMEFREAVRSKE
jgi:hypothetical protein